MKVRTRVILVIALALFFFILAAVSYLSFKSGIFLLHRIEVHGCETVDAQHVVSLSMLSENTGMFFLSKKNIKNGIERDPLLQVVSIRMRYPDTVVIHIREREAIALIRVGNRLVEVNAEGRVLRQTPRDFSIPVISPYEVVISNKRIQDNELIGLLAVLAERRDNGGIYQLVSEIVVLREEIRMFTKNPVISIRFTPPYDEKMKKIEAIIAIARGKDEKISSIDMRFDAAIVR